MSDPAPGTAAPPPASSFRLVRYFTVASLIAFLFVGGSWLYFDHQESDFFREVQQEQSAYFAQIQNDFVQRHGTAAPDYLLSIYEASNISLARLLVNALWEKDIAPFMAKARHIPVDQCRAIADTRGAGGTTVLQQKKKACHAGIGRQIMSLPEFRVLDARMFDTARKTAAFKIKVYDARGITVYSSDHDQIGEDRNGAAGWSSAIAGKPASELTHRGEFAAFEGVVANRDLIETWVPVRAPDGGRIAAVLAVYSDATQFLDQIKNTSSRIRALNAESQAKMKRVAAGNQDKADERANRHLVADLGLLALLYGTLFLIVRNGQRNIDNQNVERRQTGLALARQKDLYDALSQSNKAIVRIVDRDELFATICRIAVEHGRFRFAWIGLIDKGDPGLRPVARYGEDAGYIDQLNVSGDAASNAGRGLTGRALLSGNYLISNDFLADPAMAPWHEAAQRAGVRAAAKFPIRQGGAVIGAISLYAGDAGFFTKDLVATLDEIANDVSFALDNYAREAARRRVEEELRDGEERYRQMFQTNPHPMLVYDEDTLAFLAVNDAAVAQYGWSRGEFLAMTIADIHRAEDMPFLREYFAVNKEKEFRTFDGIAHRKKDGALIDVEIASHVVELNGRRARIVSAINITERKKAEAVRDQLAAIVENSNDAIYSRTLDGTILSWNPGAEKVLGYTAAEAIGKSVAMVIPPGNRGLLRKQNNEKMLRGETIAAREATRLTKDGRVIDVIVSNSPVKDGAGRVIAASVILKDITEYRRAQDALRAAEEQFRGLVEQSIAGIYIVQDGKLAYVNPRAAEIVGQGSADELLGTDPLVWVVEADRGKVAENLRRLVKGEAQNAALDFGVLRRDGIVIQVGAHAARATHEGRPAVIGLVQDISEKKRAEEEIQRYVAQLRVAFMSTVQMATTLSEMRDPYTTGHERRVAEIAAAIGAELGLDARQQEGLRVAGYLHDVGKITVPAEILSKPGKLSAIEFQLVQGHAQASYDVLKEVEFPWQVAQVALQHHERMDGSGYPQGLRGDAILFEARIMAVADVIEAMSSHRPYRPALGIDKALAEIERGRGTAYDAGIADACLRLFREKGYSIPM